MHSWEPVYSNQQDSCESPFYPSYPRWEGIQNYFLIQKGIIIQIQSYPPFYPKDVSHQGYLPIRERKNHSTKVGSQVLKDEQIH